MNQLSAGEVENELLKCCGSSEWARRMLEQKPFENVDDLIRKAESIWWSLEPRDWLDAFHSHPKIGEQQAARATAVEAQKWSSEEQAGIGESAPDTIAELAELNRRYEEKFGYIFIVCASGKSSGEIRSILRQRIENAQDEELRNAASEQAKITELRLRKLLRT